LIATYLPTAMLIAGTLAFMVSIIVEVTKYFITRTDLRVL